MSLPVLPGQVWLLTHDGDQRPWVYLVLGASPRDADLGGVLMMRLDDGEVDAELLRVSSESLLDDDARGLLPLQPLADRPPDRWKRLTT